MSKSYTQCRLRKGNSYTTAWIPSELASPGGFIKLYGENGWWVEEVYNTALEREERSRDYLYQRKASDR